MQSEPRLPAGWMTVPLEDLSADQTVTYGVVQPGAAVADGVPMLRVNNFRGYGLDTADVLRISRDVEAKYVRTRLQTDDVLITIVGSVGQVALVPKELQGWNLARAVALVRPRHTHMARWIALCLRSPRAQHSLGIAANTTVQTTINLKDLRQLRVPLPPLSEREVIAEVLGALDDRIDLLRQTNATLEAIAQALFKSWFIDFDPVRAKAEGREPDGMDAATAALFPATFEDSPLGPIPAGWRVGSVRDACAIFDSRRVPLSSRERSIKKGPYPYYGAAALMDYVDDFLFDGVFLLLGEDGSVTNPDGTPIMQYVWGKLWVNNHAHVLQGSNGISTEHLMLALRRVDLTPYVTGAVQAKLNQANLFRVPFTIPRPEISKAFGVEIDPIYASYRNNQTQAQTLAELRDTLLPRLISGRLRVPEAREQIDEVFA